MRRRLSADCGSRSAVVRGRQPRDSRPALSTSSGWPYCWPLVGLAIYRVVQFASQALSWSDVEEAVGLGLITLVRVVVLMIIASLVWVPIGVWLGLRPVWARRAQPIAQFLAAFPANLLFPPFVLFIVYFHLSPDIWLTPLMVLGTQWYILFNVVAGAAAFPGDLKEAAANFRIGRMAVVAPRDHSRGSSLITSPGPSPRRAAPGTPRSWPRWRPGATPNFKRTGWVPISPQRPIAATCPGLILGVVVMSAFVVLFNRLLWRPMYAYAQRRLTLA